MFLRFAHSSTATLFAGKNSAASLSTKMHLLSYKVYLWFFNLLLSSGAVHGRGFISPRIIGGNQVVTAGNLCYPWFTWVYGGCRGQIITTEFILTAAKCIRTVKNCVNGKKNLTFKLVCFEKMSKTIVVMWVDKIICWEPFLFLYWHLKKFFHHVSTMTNGSKTNSEKDCCGSGVIEFGADLCFYGSEVDGFRWCWWATLKRMPFLYML